MRIRNYLSPISFCVIAATQGFGDVSLFAQTVSVDSVRIFHRTLDETEVTAVKINKSVKDATPAFTIDKESFLRHGITDIADAIHRLPGATLRDYGGAGGLKTVSVRGLGSSHTAVSYDGLPLSDISTGAIDLSRYSTDNIENLSLIIGDNDDLVTPVRIAAAPASVNITPLLFSSNKKRDFTVRLKMGSWQMLSPFLSFTTSLSSTTRVNINGEFLHAVNNYPFKWVNGNIVTTERRKYNGINSGHLEGNLQWQKGGSTLTVKGYCYDNNHHLPGPVLYYNVNSADDRLRIRNAFGQSTFTQTFSSNWKFNVAGKFNYSSTSYSPDVNNPAVTPIPENYFQREYYFTSNLLFTPSKNWALDYGIDYAFNNLNSNTLNNLSPRRNTLLQSISARFTKSRLTAKVRIIESLYFDKVSGSNRSPLKNHDRLSPSASLSFRLLREGQFYARVSYKNIFRMPTFNEAYYGQFGNPDLKPESTDQFDAGLTYQQKNISFLKSFIVTADVYYNRVNDRIVSVPYNLFVWLSTNLDRVDVKGADITLSSSVGLSSRTSLLLNGTWSYQRARIHASRESSLYGKQVAYTPLNSGSFSVTCENPWVNLVWHGQGCSARYTNNNNIPESRLGGYFEFGATAWRSFALKQCALELRLDILNIFDKQYFVIARYPMPGRSWQFSVKFTL